MGKGGYWFIGRLGVFLHFLPCFFLFKKKSSTEYVFVVWIISYTSCPVDDSWRCFYVCVCVCVLEAPCAIGRLMCFMERF